MRRIADVGTVTGSGLGVCPRVAMATPGDEILFQLSQGRNVLDVARTGPHGTTVAETRTNAAGVDYDTPGMYLELWFRVVVDVE
jgi:hypothetical protein